MTATREQQHEPVPVKEVNKRMVYEVRSAKYAPDEWRVEAFDEEGRAYVTVFMGPASRERAEAYAAIKNGR